MFFGFGVGTYECLPNSEIDTKNNQIAAISNSLRKSIHDIKTYLLG